MLFFDKHSKDRLERNGYKVIHLFGRLYLVRKYSKGYRKLSLYGLAMMKRGIVNDR